MYIVSHMEGTDLGMEVILFGFSFFLFLLLTGLALSWTHSDPGLPALVASTKERDGTVPFSAGDSLCSFKLLFELQSRES